MLHLTKQSILKMGNFKSFGSLINRLRIERNLSQRVVADKIGIDVSMLSKIEHGERQVQPHMVISIANIFGMDAKILEVEYLVSRITEEYGSNPYFKESIKKCLTA